MSFARYLAEIPLRWGLGASAAPRQQRAPSLPRDIRNSREVQSLVSWMESGRPLLVEPRQLHGMLQPLLAGDEDALRAIHAANGGAARPVVAGDIAVIPVRGLILAEDSWVSDMMGWSTVQGLTATVRQYAADPQIKTVVWDSRSPGGMGDGGEFSELAGLGYKLRDTKRTVAISRYMMASAAAWICLSAKNVLAAPLSLTGSIGCYTVLFDESEMWAAMGVKPIVKRSDPYKGEGSGLEPITPEYEAHVQSIVDACATTFRADVAKFRGVSAETVRKSFGQGRSLLPAEAKAAGLVDRVMSSEDFSERLATGRIALADGIEIDPETWRALGFTEPAQAAGEENEMDDATLTRLLEGLRSGVKEDIAAAVAPVQQSVTALDTRVTALATTQEAQAKDGLAGQMRTFVDGLVTSFRLQPSMAEEEIATLCEATPKRRASRMKALQGAQPILGQNARQPLMIEGEDGQQADGSAMIPDSIMRELEVGGKVSAEDVQVTAQAIKNIGGPEALAKEGGPGRFYAEAMRLRTQGGRGGFAELRNQN